MLVFGNNDDDEAIVLFDKCLEKTALITGFLPNTHRIVIFLVMRTGDELETIISTLVE